MVRRWTDRDDEAEHTGRACPRAGHLARGDAARARPDAAGDAAERWQPRRRGMVQRMRPGRRRPANAGRRIARGRARERDRRDAAVPGAELDEDADVAPPGRRRGGGRTGPPSPLARTSGDTEPASRSLRGTRSPPGRSRRRSSSSWTPCRRRCRRSEGQQGANLTVGSKPLQRDGNGDRLGAAAEVAKYETGFVQTVFRSSRRFSYARQNHQPGIAERVLPSIFGTGTKTTSSPGFMVKDGDTYVTGDDKGEKLYYEKNNTMTFANASPDQQTTDALRFGLTRRTTGRRRTRVIPCFLVKTRGLDTFRTWFGHRKKSWSSTSYRRPAGTSTGTSTTGVTSRRTPAIRSQAWSRPAPAAAERSKPR